jgi:hypothetical protein
MTALKRITKWLGGGILVITLLLVIAYQVFVQVGLSRLPELKGPTVAVFPYRVQRIFWISEFGTGSFKMRPISFWKMIYDVAKSNHRLPAYQQAASVAGKKMIQKIPRDGYRNIRFQLDWAFASIWISKYWTAEETVNTILEESDFGSDHPGINNAAVWYFGTALDSLTNEEVVFLSSIVRAPMMYNPWRNPERVQKRFSHCLGKVDETGEYQVTLDPELGLKRLSKRTLYRENAPPTR